MALADLVAGGSDAWVAVRLFIGQSLGDIWTAIQRQFPTESLRSLEAALNRGWEAWRAGTGFQDAAPGDRLLAGEVPRPFPGRGQWRYSVYAEFGPPGGPADDARWIHLTEDHSLTRQELEGIAAQQANAMIGSGAGRTGSPPIEEQKVLLHINVAMASRL